MTIFICGDSTAASYGEDMAPFVGWGQVLDRYVPGVRIVNAAMAGRSTKTFLEEGRLARIQPEFKPGDLLLIQFGHNDAGDKPERHTEPYTTFTDNLRVFIDAAREAGVQPVLMTSICIRLFENGVLQPSLGEYPEAVRRLAAAQDVPCIDMYRLTQAHVAALGDEKSKELYLHVAPGLYERFPDGAKDDTHTRMAGADAYARLAAAELHAKGLV